MKTKRDVMSETRDIGREMTQPHLEGDELSPLERLAWSVSKRKDDDDGGPWKVVAKRRFPQTASQLMHCEFCGSRWNEYRSLKTLVNGQSRVIVCDHCIRHVCQRLEGDCLDDESREKWLSRGWANTSTGQLTKSVGVEFFDGPVVCDSYRLTITISFHKVGFQYRIHGEGYDTITSFYEWETVRDAKMMAWNLLYKR